ncbi:uncharacterized protein [Nothobranchius furzeri]
MTMVFLSMLLWFRLLSSMVSAQEGCFKVNSCKCIMKDGSGVIDLKAMGDADGFMDRLRPVDTDSTPILLTFSPCQQFSQPAGSAGGECSGVAVCLAVRSGGPGGGVHHYISYGRHEGNQFHYNHTLKTLSVSYFADRNQLMTITHFHCNPNQSRSTIRDQNLSAQGPLQIWVESPCACPNACTMGDLGLGTIFLIIFSLSAAMYFVLGSCALRPFRTSGGVQIHPESSVWCMICYFCSERQPTPGHPYTDLN